MNQRRERQVTVHFLFLSARQLQLSRLQEFPTHVPEQHTPSAQNGGHPPAHPLVPLGLVAAGPWKHCPMGLVPAGQDVGEGTQPGGAVMQSLTIVAPAGMGGLLALFS